MIHKGANCENDSLKFVFGENYSMESIQWFVKNMKVIPTSGWFFVSVSYCLQSQGRHYCQERQVGKKIPGKRPRRSPSFDSEEIKSRIHQDSDYFIFKIGKPLFSHFSNFECVSWSSIDKSNCRNELFWFNCFDDFFVLLINYTWHDTTYGKVERFYVNELELWTQTLQLHGMKTLKMLNRNSNSA